MTLSRLCGVWNIQHIYIVLLTSDRWMYIMCSSFPFLCTQNPVDRRQFHFVMFWKAQLPKWHNKKNTIVWTNSLQYQQQQKPHLILSHPVCKKELNETAVSPQQWRVFRDIKWAVIMSHSHTYLIHFHNIFFSAPSTYWHCRHRYLLYISISCKHECILDIYLHAVSTAWMRSIWYTQTNMKKKSISIKLLW